MTRDDVEQLKRKWVENPSFDLPSEGGPEYRDELQQFVDDKKNEWREARHRQQKNIVIERAHRNHLSISQMNSIVTLENRSQEYREQAMGHLKQLLRIEEDDWRSEDIAEEWIRAMVKAATAEMQILLVKAAQKKKPASKGGVKRPLENTDD